MTNFLLPVLLKYLIYNILKFYIKFILDAKVTGA